tara:strand:+ start:4627 stop:5853 length:1227 start_codon:yes stop_codon:yes gene_type:complete
MKEKLAIFVDTEITSGGAYQELLYMIDRIVEFNHDNLEIVIISIFPNSKLKFIDKRYKVYNLSMNSFDRYSAFLRNHNPTVRRIKKYFFFKNKFEELLKEKNVDIVYFTGPSQYSLYLEHTDFIITVPDVSHRENLEFPEWAKLETSEFQRREEILTKSTIRAVAVITNAETIKNQISFFYSVSKERIHVINHRPSLAISKFNAPNKFTSDHVRKLHNLPEKYIFYPAMYFPHKNHKYIIDAIKILRTKHKINLSAVFCGSDKGYLERIKKYSASQKQDQHIHFLDFVTDDDMPYLYLNSFALTMPSFSGPTNIPPWEAFKMEVPVFYSDLKDIREVYKDAVYYIDHFDSSSLANGIVEILKDDNKRLELINNGKKLLKSINTEKEFDKIFEILKKRIKIKETWELNH